MPRGRKPKPPPPSQDDFVEKVEMGEDLPDADDPPTSIDPYEVLDLPTDATPDDIKRSYRKLALRHHPDKAADADKHSAKEAFQRLAFAYAILSDPARRARYDATGSTSESVLDAEGDDFDWLSFYRAQFENVITEEKISQFAGEYKSSEEERGDLLAAYQKHQGDMDRIYDSVMLSNVLEDDGRFRNIIEDAIESGEVEGYPKYTNESDQSKAARVKRAKNEARAAEREKANMQEKKTTKKKGGDEVDLAAMIASNQQKRAGFLDDLEAKYAPKGRKRMAEEPPEEAFAKNQRKGRKAKG